MQFSKCIFWNCSMLCKEVWISNYPAASITNLLKMRVEQSLLGADQCFNHVTYSLGDIHGREMKRLIEEG